MEIKMHSTCIILFGLKASGKSYFGQYLETRIGASFIYLPRMLESKLCSNNVDFYEEYTSIMQKKSRICVIEILKNDIKDILEKSRLCVIEGLLSPKDIEWLKKLFNINIIKVLIKNSNDELRLSRYISRHGKSNLDAVECLKLNDEFRISAYGNSLELNADYIIENNSDEEAYKEKIDAFLKKKALI